MSSWFGFTYERTKRAVKGIQSKAFVSINTSAHPDIAQKNNIKSNSKAIIPFGIWESTTNAPSPSVHPPPPSPFLHKTNFFISFSISFDPKKPKSTLSGGAEEEEWGKEQSLITGLWLDQGGTKQDFQPFQFNLRPRNLSKHTSTSPDVNHFLQKIKTV